jgi:hypothetical protein
MGRFVLEGFPHDSRGGAYAEAWTCRRLCQKHGRARRACGAWGGRVRVSRRRPSLCGGTMVGEQVGQVVQSYVTVGVKVGVGVEAGVVRTSAVRRGQHRQLGKRSVSPSPSVPCPASAKNSTLGGLRGVRQDETAVRVDGNVVQRVETFLAARWLEPPGSARQPFLWYGAPRTSLRVTAFAIFERQLKVVADHAEPVVLCGCGVAAASASPFRVPGFVETPPRGVQAASRCK